MDITFDSNKLEKFANDDKRAFQKLGPKRAQLLKRRLDNLRAAENLEEVRHLPGNYHELRQNRKGQWSCNLDHPYRLIFVPHEDPIPTDEDGKYLWDQILGVEVVEIVDYH